jgi:hypothetical protein
MTEKMMNVSDLWLEGRKPFYQGLLQVAVSCYHLEQGNHAGVVKLMQLAVQKLSIYPNDWQGIKVDKIILDAKNYLNDLRDSQGTLPTSIYIEIWDKQLSDLVEQIKFP